ncbi:MAG: RluA family pseudouridine synthase [Solirubrobacterales bacterium]|nr:RluA family pseudouridine synthase [Solirubrobacterales bacterium]
MGPRGSPREAVSAVARIELRVPEDVEGTRLDRFLADAVGSRTRAQALIDAGRVRVDGALVAKRHLVHSGEAILVDEAPAEPGVVSAQEAPFEVAPFEVAYEDEHLLVVEKPAGVVVHPARGHWSGTLAQALAGRAAGGEETWRAGIVHRLDRDTSGLLVVAKNDAVHRGLKALLAQRQLRREYLALADGHPSARTGTIDAPIGRHRRDRKLMSIDSDDPREARTHFEIERLLPGAALLRVALETGRTHQIRVHLAAIGHPVCGDPQYGTAGRFGLARQFLHAARLAFVHPVTGKEVDVRSELPADLAGALAAAERGEIPGEHQD